MNYITNKININGETKFLTTLEDKEVRLIKFLTDTEEEATKYIEADKVGTNIIAIEIKANEEKRLAELKAREEKMLAEAQEKSNNRKEA